MLPIINKISTQQSKPTGAKIEKVTMLIDYAHNYPDAKIRYYTSDMQLNIDPDAAYLVLPKTRWRGAGHFYFNDKLKNMTSSPKAMDLF